ncbi:MAG: bile acid:sodium symporter family protein [Planctomycetales bacterium]
MLERFLIAWLTLLSAIAYFWPSLLGAFGEFTPEQLASLDPFTLSKGFLQPIFAVTMFCIGTLLPRNEVEQVFRRWPTVLGGTAIQFLVMPLSAFLIASLFDLSPSYRIGVILVGCVPGAMASNVVTLTARGNVSYSVSLTTAATLLSPLATPLILSAMIGDVAGDPSPGKKVWDLFCMVVAPVVTGHLFARPFPKFQSLMKIVGPRLANLTILWIIAVIVALNRKHLGEQGAGQLLLPLLLVNLVGYLAGYFGGATIGLDGPMRRALTLEVGMQNAGLGAVLASKWFPDQPEIAIPTAMYTFGCMFTGVLLAQVWLRFPPKDAEDTEPDSADKPSELPSDS